MVELVPSPPSLEAIPTRTQHGRQVRIVFVADARRFLQRALCLQPGGRNVLPLGGILDGRNGIARIRRCWVNLGLAWHKGSLGV